MARSTHKSNKKTQPKRGSQKSRTNNSITTEKNLHAQPVGKPKVCTTPCLTPTSTNGQTLLEVMPMTIAQERIPLPMSPTTQYQVAIRNKSCVHPTYTQKPKKNLFRKSYTTNAKQPSLCFTFFQKILVGEVLCVPVENQSRKMTSNAPFEKHMVHGSRVEFQNRH